LPPGGSSVLGPIQLTNSSDHTAFKDTWTVGMPNLILLRTRFLWICVRSYREVAK
jgi:hypothetical protein